MYLVYLGAVLIALKLFEVKYIDQLSWWWILLPLGLAALYFEVIEPMLGLDKKKAHDEDEKYRKKRKEAQLRADWNRKQK